MSTTLVMRAAGAALMALALTTLPGCTGKSRDALQVKGSGTMVNLGSAWANAFMAKNPDAAIAVTGGGSGTGISALINGSCDVAQASRAMKEKERKMAADRGRNVQEFEVAIDCVVVCVHPQNPVRVLTIAQLSDIYTEKITNWKEVGGRDAPIDAVSRDRNSGTHHYFLEQVVQRGEKGSQANYAPAIGMLPSSQAIYDEVAANENAIGYYGLGYVGEKNKAVAVAKVGGTPTMPSLETALDDSYPIARPLFIYTVGEPAGAGKAFLHFVLSAEGQAIVKAEGFVPLKPIQAS